jgi:hypothetical protein
MKQQQNFQECGFDMYSLIWGKAGKIMGTVKYQFNK